MSVRNLDISLFEIPQSTEGISGMHMPDERAQSGPRGMPDERVFQRKSENLIDDSDFEFDVNMPSFEEFPRIEEAGVASTWNSSEYAEYSKAFDEYKAIMESIEHIRSIHERPSKELQQARKNAFSKLDKAREKWLALIEKRQIEREQGLRSIEKSKKKDLIPGGLGDYKDISEFDSRQLNVGIRDEMAEHTNDPEIALEIVKDHLTKDPFYYKKEEQRNLRHKIRKMGLGILSLPTDSYSQEPVANRLGLDESEYEVSNQLLGADSPVDTEPHPQNLRNQNYEYPQVKGEDPNFIHFLFGDIDNMRHALEELKSSMKQSGREKESKKISDLIQKTAQVDPEQAAQSAYQAYRAAAQAFPKVMDLASMGDVRLNQAVSAVLNKYLPGSPGFDAQKLQDEMTQAFSGRYLSDADTAAIANLASQAAAADQAAKEFRLQTSPAESSVRPSVAPAKARPIAHTTPRAPVLFKGPDVVKVQNLLKVTPADGLWGPQTQAAWLAQRPEGAPEQPESAAEALKYLTGLPLQAKPEPTIKEPVEQPAPTEKPTGVAFKAMLISQRMDGPDGRPIGVVDYGNGRHGGATMRDGKWVPTTLSAKEQRYLGLGRLQTGLMGPGQRPQREIGKELRQERRRADRISALDEIKKSS